MTFFRTENPYVHLREANGFEAGVTCETLGYLSINTSQECIAAASRIKDIANYVPYDRELDCHDTNPNFCFTSMQSEKIYFTPTDCPVHRFSTRESNGLICKDEGTIENN